METQVIQMGFTTEQRIRMAEYVHELTRANSAILQLTSELEDETTQRIILPACEKIGEAGTRLLNLVK